ncbi:MULTISPECIES: 2Fe-2S iron-sulfur cluster-binding protein [Amycolatopsis]|uniref:2Fe-2S iron-sulfur cluster-binding protein n=1 Tax=Amycolatopsis TaxID=1813 RepID=UPI00056B5A23|nr:MULTISPECIES: 2Fe-2S iron-sulfur cluster-binding protein [Amycolatopsis]MCG3749543.1 2Fe-2S iron-sulfur cluster binding domain-containing protein [Amycolatopsis sp. Poz14]
MPTVIFVRPGGDRRPIEVGEGVSVMEAAVDNGIDEILAECGGNATCATCHVFVCANDLDRMPAVSELENEMLDGTAEPRRATSRLACQLVADPALDGLTVYLPETQC